MSVKEDGNRPVSPPCSICGGVVRASGTEQLFVCGDCMRTKLVCPWCLTTLRRSRYGFDCDACETNWGVEEDGKIL